MSNSVGLIESKGLVALIEAADVILKNSPVNILGIHKLENGLVTLAVSGNSDYVKAAIESAVEAGRRIGEIYASSVIDDPGKDLLNLFSGLFSTYSLLETATNKSKSENFSEVTTGNNNVANLFASVAKKVKLESKREKSKPLSVSKITPIHKIKKVKDRPSSERKDVTGKLLPENFEEDKNRSEHNEEDIGSDKPLSTIERLRIEALGLEHKKIKAEEIALPIKKKDVKIKQVNIPIEVSKIDFDAINKMNVHKLRHYAREFPQFPIKGRAISRANRDELFELFKSINKK